MKNKFIIQLLIIFGLLPSCVNKQEAHRNPKNFMNEKWRPQIHFSPVTKWMNDPNGLVYFNGEFHLFYQHNPEGSVWGPMHWGHAISKDLVHWKHLPIALYPDSLGTIFSGSAVADIFNTSGFGHDGKIPLVAIYTNHSHKKESHGDIDFQTQSIAYSLDNGRSWTKYKGNPVIKNPGIKDFRDPKVIWYEAEEKWIMALAVKDRVSFYSSPDLKHWTFESDFGGGIDHGGVVECPDLFPLKTEDGEEKWILLVSLNPGAPNGGSGTKYYVGDFDGKEFVSDNPVEKELWLDYGKDNYAGVTWSNVPGNGTSRLFIGWMSNWEYATLVPTEKWRGANTLPRQLILDGSQEDGYFLAGTVIDSINEIAGNWQYIDGKSHVLKAFPAYQLKIDLESSDSSSFKILLSNSVNNQVEITFDLSQGMLSLDRSKSGKVDFHKSFSQKVSAPLYFGKIHRIELFVDQTSIELFVNNGRIQMTNIVFPETLLNQISISKTDHIKIVSAKIRGLKSIWN